jgi:hypothetical protein
MALVCRAHLGQILAPSEVHFLHEGRIAGEEGAEQTLKNVIRAISKDRLTYYQETHKAVF